MADTIGSTCADLSDAGRITDAGRYNFYQLVELLHKQESRPATFPTSVEDETVHFLSSASIAFPSRDVVSLEKNANNRWQLTTSFMGLHGSQSPLPGYYLDALAWEEAQGDNKLTDFFNLFNHRSLTLLHHIWRKYRYYVCFEDEGVDSFSQRMFSLVGLGSPALRNKLQINHSKMLAYAGLLASPGRSPDVICGLIAHCFELDDVTLESWQLRQMKIAPDQQNRLGSRQRLSGNRVMQKSVLGENFSLGERVFDRSGKFLLCINGLFRKRFLSFLPNGENYLPLVMFVSFILRDQFAWDLKLGIADQQVDGMMLGVENALLGWTCFLGEPVSEPEVTICVRE
ncbi:type VI secretion system baseplate subunit TssG [Edaphovirga cremea]|uniref:type VI secretion system baseplate subunit TssG n=1 Tax=Edaphovirga cremea TaxID=2267246 RepID=UPI00398A1464